MLAVQLKPNPRLSLEELEGIAPYGATTRWPAGFAVYERLAPADGIFVVRSGQIVLRNPLGSGRSFVPWVATVGETFGGEGLQSNARYASAARAESPSETLHLSNAQFSALLREQPTAALALVRQVMAERTTLLEKYGEHATLTVEQRLVAALVRLSTVEHGGAPPDRPMISRRLLGELVGATRESDELHLGVSPRGALALTQAAQASAVLNGRDYATPDDVKDLFIPVCAHRVIGKTYLHNGDAKATERVLQDILDRTPTPK